MIHELKIHPEHFNDVISGAKKAEIRKNDRNFKVNDWLRLMEFDGKEYTGRRLDFYITHILDDETYLQKGFVMLSIEKTPF